MTRGGPGYWNIWWTLTIAALAFTFAVVVLEAIGAFRDLGLVTTAFGLLVGIFFGLTAATRTSVTMLGAQLLRVTDEVREVRAEVRRVGSEVRDLRGDVRTVGDEIRTVVGEVRVVGGELGEVRRILEERLPRPA